MINYSRFIWTPNLLIPLSGVCLALLLLINKLKRNYLLLCLGFFLGIGLQLHYSFLLVMILSLFWILSIKKIGVKEAIFMLSGFIFGFSPILIFEIRNKFYNTQTLFFILNTISSHKQSFPLSSHYILPLLPFILYFVSKIILRLIKYSRRFAFLLIGIFIFWSLVMVIPKPSHGFSMPDNWNYQALRKVEDIILSSDRENYNLVDVLTGDTRAMALRYLLTVSNKPPLGVTEYSKSSAIFLYTREPIEKVIKGSLWELDGIKPVVVSGQWQIVGDIYLYLLERFAPVLK